MSTKRSKKRPAPSSSSSSSKPPTKKGKKRQTRKMNKGLRHFSVKVCEKLEATGLTTYNEIATLLIEDYMVENSIEATKFDQKNIRRRIYDALNVLTAMDIIQKERKQIRWKGIKLSVPGQDTSELEREVRERVERLEGKQQLLQELTLQYVALKNVVERNAHPELAQRLDRLTMPFIVMSTDPHVNVACEMTDSRKTVSFEYSGPFELCDDAVILRELGTMAGMDQIRQVIPHALHEHMPLIFPRSDAPLIGRCKDMLGQIAASKGQSASASPPSISVAAAAAAANASSSSRPKPVKVKRQPPPRVIPTHGITGLDSAITNAAMLAPTIPSAVPPSMMPYPSMLPTSPNAAHLLSSLASGSIPGTGAPIGPSPASPPQWAPHRNS